MAIKKNDYLWKGILEDVFEYFLRFMHPEADKIFDFDRGITFLDKELEQLFPPEGDEFSPKIVDKLAKVYTLDGKEEWILVHIEVQGDYRKDFGKRMYDYFVRIRDKYGKPVTAYAIFTEAVVKQRPDYYEEVFLGTGVHYRFNTCQIAALDDQVLRASDNLFALTALVAKTAFAGRNIKNAEERDTLLLKLKTDLARLLLYKEVEKKKIRQLMNFLKNYVRFENPEKSSNFEQEIEIITQNKTIMGLEELILDMAEKKGEAKGQAKGEAKKSYAVVENLIINYGFSNEQIADMAKVSVEFVEKVRKELNKD